MASLTGRSVPDRQGLGKLQRQATHASQKATVRCHPGRRVLIVRAGSMQLLSMPLFESRDVCHPTSTGVLSIFEPRYVSMLAQHSRFVHVLSRDVVAVIPELAKDSLDGGLPRVGVLVNVRSVQEDGQTRLVAYEGVRRVRLLMLEEAEPYTVAAVEPLDDNDEGRLAVSQPEQEVYTALQEVYRLQSELAHSEDAQPALPAALERYAPPPDAPSQPADTAQYLRKAGHPIAAQQVATWQRASRQQQASRRRAANPYAELAEEVGCSRRSEMFSFAAAGVLDMGMPERLALLLTRSTLGRLEYVLAAVRPYLQQLRTAAAMHRALPLD